MTNKFFLESVRNYFYFLETEFKFSLLYKRLNTLIFVIRYESTQIYVQVFFNSTSEEIDLSFGRIKLDEPPIGNGFTLGELMQIGEISVNDWKDASLKNRSTSLSEIRVIAQLLHELGADYLAGNSVAFSKLIASRIQRKEENRIISIKKEADIAWSNKDYVAVEKLYGKIASALSKAELLRRQYAQKHID